MIRSVTVYQMTYGQDNEGNAGLVFTTEQEEYGNQSVLFTIPITDNFPFHHPMEFVEYLESVRITFPFQLNEEYYELEGKVNFPEVVFNIPNSDIKITFEIDNDHIFYWHVFPFRRRPYRKLKYVGKQKHLIKDNNGFLILQPVDLYEMDELYLKHKGVFVGLTPNFGNSDNINRQ